MTQNMIQSRLTNGTKVDQINNVTKYVKVRFKVGVV